MNILILTLCISLELYVYVRKVFYSQLIIVLMCFSGKKKTA